ncbi:CRISPR-associated protein Cas2 [hydrothermal vent metagenome]|uniref:CRISPR-associated protein Cas2 n=1 Tax=hydrothermal vent metagenome TaxID=652676 RepID=A0A3B1CCM6_9ZZZZ
MYIIIIYDAAPKRGAKILKFLRKHLIWIQNSVFEGAVTEAQFEVIKKGIKNIINKEKDSVIIYKFDSQNYTDRDVIGIEKNETDSFI